MAHAPSYAAPSYLVADYLIVAIIRIHSTVKSKHDYEGDLHWGKEEKKKVFDLSWLHAEFLCRTSFKPLMSCSYLHFVVLFWDVSCLVEADRQWTREWRIQVKIREQASQQSKHSFLLQASAKTKIKTKNECNTIRGYYPQYCGTVGVIQVIKNAEKLQRKIPLSLLLPSVEEKRKLFFHHNQSQKECFMSLSPPEPFSVGS